MQILQSIFQNQQANAAAMGGAPSTTTFPQGDQNIWGNLSNALGVMAQKDWSKAGGGGTGGSGYGGGSGGSGTWWG